MTIWYQRGHKPYVPRHQLIRDMPAPPAPKPLLPADSTQARPDTARVRADSGGPGPVGRFQLREREAAARGESPPELSRVEKLFQRVSRFRLKRQKKSSY